MNTYPLILRTEHNFGILQLFYKDIVTVAGPIFISLQGASLSVLVHRTCFAALSLSLPTSFHMHMT